MRSEAESWRAWGTVSRKAMWCNTRVAFCFGFIYDCLTVKMRTLFVLREQTVVAGYVASIALAAANPSESDPFA